MKINAEFDKSMNTVWQAITSAFILQCVAKEIQKLKTNIVCKINLIS